MTRYRDRVARLGMKPQRRLLGTVCALMLLVVVPWMSKDTTVDQMGAHCANGCCQVSRFRRNHAMMLKQ